MAMTSLAPAITRSKALIVEKSSQAVLRLVPDISVSKQADRRYFAKIVSMLGITGLMFLLFINTLLAQDAFELNRLKLEVKMVSDQREAIDRVIDSKSAPEALAKSAIALGMRPSETPVFLNLERTKAPTGVKTNG